MGYMHLTMDEREFIAQSLAAGLSVPEIARPLGRVPSTIYRERTRNATATGRYSPSRAQSAYEARREASKRPFRLEADPALRLRVTVLLKASWSPEQIAERRAAERPRRSGRRLGFKTIYRWLARDRAAGGALYKHLRQRGGHYRKRYGSKDRRGQIRDRRPLSDFEGDTVCVGRRAALATHVDRKSRFLVAAPLRDGRAASLNRATIAAFAKIPRRLRRTLTVDNGREFAAHQRLERALGLRVYFAPPYQSWQRGTNENTNGLLREFFPKKNPARPTRKRVDRAVRLLNNRPRKCLDWRTPAEVFLPKGRFRVQFH